MFQNIIIWIIKQQQQQNIPPIHPTLTAPQNKNTRFPQTTLASTVEPCSVRKYSHMEYQTYRPIAKTRQSNKQKHVNKNNFANQNFDFFAINIISNPIAKNHFTYREINHKNIIPQPVPNIISQEHNTTTTITRT